MRGFGISGSLFAVVRRIFAVEAAESFWTYAAHAGMNDDDLAAAALDACKHQVREAPKMHALWEATANQREFDAEAAVVICAAFRSRLAELTGNACLWGLSQ